MHNDAVIFDIDGTLWNACKASARGWTNGLKALGIDRQISTEEIASIAGHPYETCVDILMPGLRSTLPALVQTLMYHEEAEVREQGGEFYPRAIDSVRLISHSSRVFLVSNCQVWYLECFLHFSGLKDILTGSDCYGQASATKEQMLRKMKIDYALKNPVYIGDTDGDKTAARQAGMEFIHVDWGFGKGDGSHTMTSFPELVTYLNSST